MNQFYPNMLTGRKLFLSKIAVLLFVEEVSLGKRKATLKVQNNLKTQHSAKVMENQRLLQGRNMVIQLPLIRTFSITLSYQIKP